MKKEDAATLEPGEQLLTTEGNKVTFVELTVVDEAATENHPARKRKVAIVELADGTTTAIPPRSLHRLK